MRATASSLTWALAAISGTAYAAEPTSEEHLSAPYVVPAQFNWLQDLANRFANYIDVLSLQFSGVLGGWSRQPVLFAITPAKIILLLLILTCSLVLAALVRALIFK